MISYCPFYFFFFHGTSRLKERLGCEPSDDQLATSLRIPRAELHSKVIESSLAREKLAMSNVRLVLSIAQRYETMGADMADLVQVFYFSCMTSNMRYYCIDKLNYCICNADSCYKKRFFFFFCRVV